MVGGARDPTGTGYSRKREAVSCESNPKRNRVELKQMDVRSGDLPSCRVLSPSCVSRYNAEIGHSVWPGHGHAY